jgi:hypothetical protein
MLRDIFTASFATSFSACIFKFVGGAKGDFYLHHDIKQQPFFFV